MFDLMEFLLAVAGLFPEVLVAAAVIAAVINIIKFLDWLPDGYAPLLSKVLNALFWGFMYFSGKIGIGDEASELLITAGPFMVAIFNYFVALAASDWWHNLLKKGKTVFGFSFSQGRKPLTVKA